MTAKIARLTLLVALSMAGCAQLPDSGPVERVVPRAARDARQRPVRTRTPAAGRHAAADRRGYLDAMLAYPEVHRHRASYPHARSGRRNWSVDGRHDASYSSRRITDQVNRRDDEACRPADHRPANSWRWTTSRPGDGECAALTSHVYCGSSGSTASGASPTRTRLPRDSRSSSTTTSGRSRLGTSTVRASGLYPIPIHVVVGEQLPLTLTRRLAAGPRLSAVRTYLPGPDDLRVSITGRRSSTSTSSVVAGGC